MEQFKICNYSRLHSRQKPAVRDSQPESECRRWRRQFAKSLLQFFGLTVMPRCLLDISIFWSCGRTSMHIRRMRSGTPRPSGVSPVVVEAELPVVRSKTSEFGICFRDLPKRSLAHQSPCGLMFRCFRFVVFFRCWISALQFAVRHFVPRRWNHTMHGFKVVMFKLPLVIPRS